MNQYTNYLSALIDACRGSYRNMEEYARDCNLGVATVYRIARSQVKKKPSEEVLRALVDNADPSRGITYEDLLKAISDVLEHQDADPLDRSRKIRRDAQRAEESFAEAIVPYLEALPAEIPKTYKRHQSRWDFKTVVFYDGREETWLFAVRYQAADGPFLRDRFSAVVGRFVIDEGPVLDNKWLHIVIASPDQDIEAKTKNRFSKIESAVPVSVIPMCTANNIIYPEILLYHGRKKLPVTG